MAISKVQPKVKTIDTPVKQQKQKDSYAKNLSQTTKTVAQLYDAYQNYFPVEYGLLINPLRVPDGNGNILRFSKNAVNGYVMVASPDNCPSVESGFTASELADLSNCRVFLEPNQTELNYIDRWFNYVIAERGISNYRLRQMYWMSKLDNVSEDYVKDPDYIPEDESEAEDEDYEYESETEEDNTDEDHSPDYTPSVESEAEDSEAEDEEEESQDEDDSPDYTPSVESEEEDSDEDHDSEDDKDDDSEAEEDEDHSPDYTPSVESEEEDSDEDDYEDVVRKYNILKQKLKVKKLEEQNLKQVGRKYAKTRSH
jgi:transcriptional regulator with XRE-family HTH domain